jgi:hypothetical protein
MEPQYRYGTERIVLYMITVRYRSQLITIRVITLQEFGSTCSLGLRVTAALCLRVTSPNCRTTLKCIQVALAPLL